MISSIAELLSLVTTATPPVRKEDTDTRQVTIRNWIALDLDKTLLQCKYTQSSLLSMEGAQILIRYMDHLHLPLAVQQYHLTKLHHYMNTKTLMEDNAIQILDELRKRGVFVFAITSRYASTSEITFHEMNSLGLSFIDRHPFPKRFFFCFFLSFFPLPTSLFPLLWYAFFLFVFMGWVLDQVDPCASFCC